MSPVRLSFPQLVLEMEIQVVETEQVRYGPDSRNEFTRIKSLAFFPNGESTEVSRLDVEISWKEAKKIGLFGKLWRLMVIATQYDQRPIYMREDKPVWSETDD